MRDFGPKYMNPEFYDKVSLPADQGDGITGLRICRPACEKTDLRAAFCLSLGRRHGLFLCEELRSLQTFYGSIPDQVADNGDGTYEVLVPDKHYRQYSESRSAPAGPSHPAAAGMHPTLHLRIDPRSGGRQR